MAKPADLTGVRYGMLVTVERHGTSNSGKAQWRCKCDCGSEVIALAQNLKSGATRSCGAHGQQSGPSSATLPERYRVLAVDGPKLGIQPSAYGFCEVFDADTRDLLFRNDPLSRLEGAGEPSPNAARGMVWLQQQGLIEPKRNQTWRQWLIAARVTVELRQCTHTDAVIAAWELSAGRALREGQSTKQPTFLPTVPQIPDATPAQQFAVDAFLADESDGAAHMERYPLDPQAAADMALQHARRNPIFTERQARLRIAYEGMTPAELAKAKADRAKLH